MTGWILALTGYLAVCGVAYLVPRYWRPARQWIGWLADPAPLPGEYPDDVEAELQQILEEAGL